MSLIWGAGVALLLGRIALGVVIAWWTSRQGVATSSQAWDEEIARVSDELGIRTPVRAIESNHVTSPMAWGLFRPTLLLPVGASSWTPLRRRAVALHELGHIKRRDPLIQILVHIVRAIHWINPLAWTAAHRLRMEQERACDDLVLNAGTRGSDYADVLIDIARAGRAPLHRWAASSMAHPAELEGRVIAILDPARDRRGFRRPVVAAAAGLVLTITLPLAAFQAAPEASAQGEGETYVEARTAPKTSTRLSTRTRTRARALVSAEPIAEARPAPVSPTPPARPAAASQEDKDPISERAIAAMIGALDDTRASTRSRAAHALGTIEDAAAVPALSQALGDEDASVREQAAWALGMIEDETAVSALASALDDESAQTRSQAAWALGKIESAEAIPSLLRRLKDDSAEVRTQAAWALGMIEQAEAVPGLVDALRSDESNNVRRQAAWALGMIEDVSAADALIDALESDTEDVAEQALWALGRVIE